MAHAGGGGGGGPAGRGLSGARWGRSGSAGHEKLPVHVSGGPALAGRPLSSSPRRPAPPTGPRPALGLPSARPRTPDSPPLPLGCPARPPPAGIPAPVPSSADRGPAGPSPLPSGGGRPHLPGPGEDPLRQRPCHLQWFPGDHEGVQKPEVPAGPLPVPEGHPGPQSP